MALIIKNLTKSFGEKQLFNDFSYRFNSNGIYALVGESGVGKTTLLRMIAGLDSNYDGVIEGGGFENVSFAFQEYRLFPHLTAIQNVIIANSETNNEAVIKIAKKMLNNLGINDDDFPLLPSELSGGMSQRVSLVRAFIKNSPVLLLDEPTKELDVINANAVLKEVSKQGKERLVIIVSHNINDINELNAVKISIN